MRDQVLLENPSFTYNEIQKELSKAWKIMSREEKQIWANAVLDMSLPSMGRKTSYPRRSSSVPTPPKSEPLLPRQPLSLPHPPTDQPIVSSISAPGNNFSWNFPTSRGKRFLEFAQNFGRIFQPPRELFGKPMRRTIG
jgi:hypothetical protein